MKLWFVLIAAGLAFPLMASSQAHARSLGSILDNSGLAPEDITAMESSARQLYEPLGRTGEQRQWSNPESRSKGAVTLGQMQGECVELVHQLKTVKRPEFFTYRTWRCRTADGVWRISPAPD